MKLAGDVQPARFLEVKPGMKRPFGILRSERTKTPIEKAAVHVLLEHVQIPHGFIESAVVNIHIG